MLVRMVRGRRRIFKMDIKSVIVACLLVAAAAAGDDDASILVDETPAPVIKPSGQKVSPPSSPDPVEGVHIIDRAGRIERIEGTNWCLVRFEQAQGQAPLEPMMALPNYLLETIEPLADRPDAPLLRIYGENSVYRGRNFIWLAEASFDAAPPVDAAPEVAPLEEESPATRPQGESPDEISQNASQAADILDRMASQRPARPILPPTPPQDAQPIAVSPIPGPRDAVIKSRNLLVTDRVVRILPEEKDGWWAMYFEGDNTLREPPIRILPGKMLQKAEQTVAAFRGRAVKFRVSGLITDYKGKQYVLLRKLIYEPDLGRF
jgi:hypothetical protein